MNTIIAAGATQDVELRYTPNGDPLLNLKLSGVRDVHRDGETRKLYSTIKITLWGARGERLAEYLHDKGPIPLLMTGSLRFWRTDTPNGPRSGLNITADSLDGYPEGTDNEIIDGEYGPLLINGFNRVTMRGLLTRDPELRFTRNEKIPILTASLAIDEYVAAKKESVTHFVDFRAWRGMAETNAQLLAKGQPALVSGSLRLDSWESQNGERRYRNVVEADRITPLVRVIPSASAGRSASASTAPSTTTPARQPTQRNLDIDEEFPPEEDLPF